MLFLKDTKTPLTGGANVGTNPKRFYHRIVSLDDIKLIKNAMNMTINDVLIGITQASLSRYMNQQYDKKNEDGALTSYPNNLPSGIRFRAGCTINLRSDIGFKPLAEMMAKDSKCRWGNYFSFIVLPFSIGLQTDPLEYLRISKAMMVRKKHSYHASIAYLTIKIGLKLFGPKVVGTLYNRHTRNVTTCISNVLGPLEEISFCGHPIAYIAGSGYGHSQALLVHFISYAGKMAITLGFDPTVIPDPHKICDEMEESLRAMKAVLRKNLSLSPTMTTGDQSKKRKQRYLPQNRPAKKKGAYPLKPGVQGFFISCDGGREHQASQEALNVIDSFFEELVQGTGSKVSISGLIEKPINKKVTFSYSDDEDEDEEEDESNNGEEKENKGDGDKTEVTKGGDNDEVEEKKGDEDKTEVTEGGNNGEEEEKKGDGDKTEVSEGGNNQVAEKETAKDEEDEEKQKNGVEEPPRKKACVEGENASAKANEKYVEKSIDKLIDAELKELGDKSKRRFMKLDPGCNGLAFIQMKRRDGDPSPKDIVQHAMTSAAATKKHMSRFILRLVPIEASCYPSEEEISRAIKPLVEQYFPIETDNPQKFAVLYSARANTGLDRMKIINTVAKSIPAPHKVDLSNPEMSIVVEIVKTVCLIGVVEKYKELAKYNLKQLTST
ncbi:hypothetical protein AALP_AA8G124600 [Arabis alpina]|uniref:THUMP domain-containing protein n=1 Tax=Arabis alpina TaxID=50452 RepID=A0A087G6L2_ARAAL|nr:hypothetical protein AALP_AA8G124600 [Arabis alpina]